jgi:hypothetical protein
MNLSLLILVGILAAGLIGVVLGILLDRLMHSTGETKKPPPDQQ